MPIALAAVGLCLASIALSGLKLVGIIDWSWWAVSLPVMSLGLSMLVLCVMLGIIAALSVWADA